MWYFVALFALFIVGVFDGHTSSFAAMLFMFLLGFLSVNSIKSPLGRSNGGKVLGIVYSVYVISAFIASRSFLDGQYFYVVDSMKYIANYSNVTSWSWDYVFSRLSNTYFLFSDDNGLYNETLSLWSYIANYYFDGASVFYLTMFQTLFGVLVSLEIYKIFSLYFDSSRAAKYTSIFALLSLFHIYSIVIIRDIVIAYFYLWGLRKVIGKPQITDGFVLLLVVVVTMGIRLYTGLFFGVFIMFWLYKIIQETKYANYRIIIIPLIILGLSFIGASTASSMLTESASGQIDSYDELYSEEGGTVSTFRNLPIGVRQVVTLFFSQLPLTNFSRFLISNNFSNYYLSTLALMFHIFNFVVFYGLMYYCFIKRLFKKMEYNDKWMLIIMLVFVAINLSTHMDYRRCMEAYPFLFLFYIVYGQKYFPYKWSKVNQSLIFASLFIVLSFSFLTILK